MSIQSHIYLHPFPLDWMGQDIIVLIATLATLAALTWQEERPAVALAEGFAFVFLYAQVYENAAGVMGSYNFGRSLVMIGYVPASIPLTEACVLFTGLWTVRRTKLPVWAWPLVIGLFGILQDLSLDPLAVRQIHRTADGLSARWNWLFDPSKDVNLLGVPVFNFPGWMLIMLYSSATILIGRWVYRKSGYKAWVGVVYPFVAALVALLMMISPISIFLLWFSAANRGQPVEWLIFGLHLAIPTILLLAFARRGGRAAFTRADAILFLVPLGLHASDILFAVIGGHDEVLGVAVAATAAHAAILAGIYALCRRAAPAGVRPAEGPATLPAG